MSFAEGYSVVLGDDGWWYVLTPEEKDDARFRKEEDANRFCLDISLRNNSLKLLDCIAVHLEEDNKIELHYDVDLIRNLYRSVFNGFNKYYLQHAYLMHISDNCKALYDKLTQWQMKNSGVADFEVKELKEFISNLYGNVNDYIQDLNELNKEKEEKK